MEKLYNAYPKTAYFYPEADMQIAYVTSNKTKFDEACYILFENPTHPIPYQIQHISLHLEEIQGTPQEIAKHKAKEAHTKLKCPVIIDDISVHCPALGGLPGPYIRSFLEALGEEGLYRLIANYEDHTCYPTCTIGFLDDERVEPIIFQSSIKAKIVAPRGDISRHGKLSWNTIVQPDGCDKTAAEMTLEEISYISARGMSLKKLKAHLQTTYFNS